MTEAKKKDYEVTDVAGNRPDIAGKRRKVGEIISLTDAEAEFELSRETIKPYKAKPEPKKD